MRVTIGAAALLLGLCACKKDEEKGETPAATQKKEGKKEGKKEEPAAAPDAAAAPAGLALKPFTLDAPAFTIELQVPEGWTEAPWSDGKMFSDPKGGIYPSFMIVGPDCAGDCGKIAENIKAFPAYQLGMHKDAGYPDTKVAKQQELPGGGLEVSFEVAEPGQPVLSYQYVRFEYEAGWPTAASCQVAAIRQEAAIKEQLHAACAAMKVTKK
jgi:hypothetical protein